MVSNCSNKTHLLSIAAVAALLSIILLAGGAFAAASIAGTWQNPQETMTFYDDGRFSGKNTQIGVFNGMYSIKENILALNYAYPAVATAQFTFAVSGNTLELSLISPQATYTRIDAAAATSTPPSTATPAPTATTAPTPKPTEPPENIVKVEKENKNLVENKPVTYTFKEPEHGISEITVTGTANQNDVSVKVEVLKSTAKSVSKPPPGEVYKNLNIVVGTTNIKEAVIKFNVENSWLASNNLASGDVRMIKWDGSKWNTLETSEKNTDGKVTYYEAKTGSFSSFAITGLKAMATPAMDSPPDSASPVAVPTKKASGFEVIFVIGTLGIVYLFGRKRK